MPLITVRFRWTIDDVLIGRRYTHKFNYLGVSFIIGVAAICCWILLKGPPPGKPYQLTTNLIILGIFVVAVICGAIALLVTRKIELENARRKFTKRPDADIEIEWNFSEAEIITSTANSKAQAKWCMFQKVISTPKGFVFMPSTEIFHFIPNRAFQSPEDIETVIELARQHATDFKILK